MGIIWEVSIGDFLLVTVFLGGGAAFLTGRAVALNWRPVINLIVYVLLLNAAVRFIHYALFGGSLLSIPFYLVDLVVLLVLAFLGFRTTRARQMSTQYSWVYERAGPLGWRARTEAGRPAA
jgi:hypothetical protein